jgi:hypothetical protein
VTEWEPLGELLHASRSRRFDNSTRSACPSPGAKKQGGRFAARIRPSCRTSIGPPASNRYQATLQK